MRTINTITILLAFVFTSSQAQTNSESSHQARTIEINNDNGDLSISFKNGVITEFIVNETPVDKEKYDDYQSIIDSFSPPSPKPPESNETLENEDEGSKLKAIILEYLRDEDIINSVTKYNVELKEAFLKVNGQNVDDHIHNECLDFFSEIYGHKLNRKSQVKFSRSGDNAKASISIVQ